MKRLISLLLALLMCLSLGACGTAAKEPTEEPADEPAADTSAEDTASEEEPIEDEYPAEEEANVVEVDVGSDPSTVSIEPVLIYGENDLEITVTGISMDSDGSSTVTMDLVNNGEEDIDWLLDYCVVNGCTIPCCTYYTVSAGTVGSAEYWIYTDEFDISVINTITLYCEYDYTNDDLDDPVLVSSDEIVTSAGADYELSIPLEDYLCVYDADGIQIFYVGCSEAYGEERVDLIIYNSTDEAVDVCPENVSFDGVMNYDNCFSFPVYPHSYAEALLLGTDLASISEAQFVVSYNTTDDYVTSDYITIALN